METQTVFFPWFSTDPAARMAMTVPSPEHIHANAMDLLAAGDAYRPVYRAAFTFRAEAVVERLSSTTLIAASAADILAAHFRRPGLAGRGQTFVDAPTLHAVAADHLADHPGTPAPDHIGDGFITLGDERLAVHHVSDGPGRPLVLLHDSGGSTADLAPVPGRTVVALDLPGHGDSAEGWCGDIDWLQTTRAALGQLGLGDAEIAGVGAGSVLARALSPTTSPIAGRTPGLPDAALSLKPEWDGAHLVRAFRIAGWEQWFDPWHCRDPDHAVHRPAKLVAVHARAVSLLKAHSRWTAFEAWATARIN
jgi:hypothetical protein